MCFPEQKHRAFTQTDAAFIGLLICSLLTYQLDVSVYHTNLVAVVQGYDQLLEKPSGFILLKPVSLLDILKHVASGSKFHCNAKELIGQEDLFELYNVRMQQPVMVEQFPLDIFCDLHAKVSCVDMPLDIPAPIIAMTV